MPSRPPTSHSGDPHDVAVVGAGVSGLTAATQLQQSGLSVCVYDKSGDIGGRLATRRGRGETRAWRWNHGAGRFAVPDDEFGGFIETLVAAGSVRLNTMDSVRFAGGHPDMRETLRPLARQCALQTNALVARLERCAALWVLRNAEGEELGRATRVLLALPAPQIVALLTDSPVVTPAQYEPLRPCRYDACWALLLAPLTQDQIAQLEALIRAGNDATFDTLTQEAGAVVLHANAAFSRQHLEATKTEVAQQLSERVEKIVDGIDAADLVYCSAHRWRFARVTNALGEASFAVSDTLLCCGDWCLGDDVAGSWRSGLSAAAAIVASPPV